MNLSDFREANVARCEQYFHSIQSWSLSDWATAMMGEGGEACNLIKKLHRGDFDDNEAEALHKIADEIADMVTYADLLLAAIGTPLSFALRKKFNEVSDRKGCQIKI